MLDRPAKAKKPHHTDFLVGQRIRLRRAVLGVSQEKLASHLGITFQQVQKYEKGVNRVGASRLQDIARILNVPVSYFFETENGEPDSTAPAPADDISAFLTTREALDLARTFAAIKDPKLRTQMLALIRTVAHLADPAPAEA
ncbi:helix-turn-helix transcriptional regulator [Ciceribacter sp. L1K22]|uniref:helix-turn-helix domain-containing protein n=1 Tax=Ciceribacter sp. L1K22 TaxID=2820275 RepID=UPI001ABE76CD|nr:helix-turn-helix transcriptional regulator [Ciceribacter sp. L1K22]MBO3760386.1 helix-turn-helix transcriptional regulator [Ciceribacter sp. L1K22]